LSTALVPARQHRLARDFDLEKRETESTRAPERLSGDQLSSHNRAAMDTEAELIALKQEVAQLKQQVAELRRFFTIEEPEKAPGQKIMTVRCSGIFLQNPAEPNKTQGLLLANDDGPTIALWGSDEKARVIINVQEDKGAVRVYQEDLKAAVDIGVNEKGESYVGVLHRGNPRAVLKALPENGAVSVVHDDGLVRAMLSSAFDHGEMFVVGGDMKAAVKLSSEGHDGGGFLTVNHANGKAAAILTSTLAGGCVILNDSQGQLVDSLPSLNSGEDSQD
jgi:hypothetical protein